MIQRATTPRVRSAALSGYLELLQEFGVKGEDLLKSYGLSTQDLADPDRYISYLSFIDLLEEAARLADCPEFGLLLSQRQELATLGVVGLLARQQSTIGQALESILHHLHLHVEGISIQIEKSPDLVRMKFAINTPGITSLRQIIELNVGLGLKTMRLLLGEKWSPDSVCFMHSPTVSKAIYQRTVLAPLLFNWEYDGFEFARETLAFPIQDTNDHLQRYLHRYIEMLGLQYGEDIEAKTRQLIADAVGTEQCTLPLVAQHLCMDERTLQRRLQESGTSFRALLETQRARLAKRHLRDSQKSLTEVALLLGYSELSAFSRSFRRWHGCSPKTWQADNNKDS